MFKKYQLPLLVFSLLSASTLGLIITRMSPCLTYGNSNICNQTSTLNLSFLYLSLLIFIASTFTTITFTLRQKNSEPEKLNHYFNTSLRQGLLFSIFSTICLLFLSLNILKWWTSLILLTLIILIEFITLQKRSDY
jgi:uncharacterized protein YacL